MVAINDPLLQFYNSIGNVDKQTDNANSTFISFCPNLCSGRIHVKENIYEITTLFIMDANELYSHCYSPRRQYSSNYRPPCLSQDTQYTC